MEFFTDFNTNDLNNDFDLYMGPYLSPIKYGLPHGNYLNPFVPCGKFTSHMFFIRFRDVKFSTRNPFLPKQKKVDAKYLKTRMKFVLFYYLSKNDVDLQKKRKTMSQVGIQKLGVPVFFTTAVVHGSLK